MKPLFDVTESKSSPLPGLSSGIVPLQYVLRPPDFVVNSHQSAPDNVSGAEVTP